MSENNLELVTENEIQNADDVVLQEYVPLIFTTLGNLPVNDLEYTNEWEITEEYIKFSETYRYHGEIVKQGAHVFSKAGAASIGNIGG